MRKIILITGILLAGICTTAVAQEKVVVIPLNSNRAAGTEGQVQYNESGKNAGAEVYYDKTTGNVGIGDPLPTEALDVNGNVKANSFIGDGSNLTGISSVETDPTVPANIKDGIGWTEVTGRPSGLDDGDDNTQLTETQVDAFVSNNGYLTSEVDGSVTNEIELPAQTGNTGKVLTTNGISPSWATDADTQLSEAQVDTYVSNNGYLTSEVDGSVTNEIELPAQTGNTGKVLTTDGTIPSWTAGVTPNQSCPAGSQMLGIDASGNIFCNDKAFVFVTSSIHTGSLGGLTGADVICNSLASSAGLPGTYMAWLSDSTFSPSTRFTIYTNRQYILTDGTVIANNWADLIDGIATTISKDESGEPRVVSVYTGTSSVGVARTGLKCSDWTSASAGQSVVIGSSGSTTNWTEGAVSPCDGERGIYCFQQ